MREKILLLILIAIIAIASWMKERVDNREPADQLEMNGLNSAICGQDCA